jgi:hypothetical protein
MTNATVSPQALRAFALQLSPNERDALKCWLRTASARELDNIFDISSNPATARRLSSLLRQLADIQPFSERVPEYGIAYRGRPGFMTDRLVQKLGRESSQFRSQAKWSLNQLVFQPDTPDGNTVCEQLAASDELYQLVILHAGPALRSYITTYLYYDIPGQCSEPHVDNAFTSITAMVGIRNDCGEATGRSSASIVYWPDRPPLEYRLEPGEIAIFFGECVLHGRTPIRSGEVVHSLLTSFRPKLDIEN